MAVPEHILDKCVQLWKADGRRKVLSVVSNSMNVLFVSGDRLLAVGGQHPRNGDICVYWRNGRFIAHRVLSRKHMHGAEQYLTKGDANPAPDDPVGESEIVARVIAIERSGNWVYLDTFPSCIVNRVLSLSARCSRFDGRLRMCRWRVCRRIAVCLGRTIWLFARKSPPQGPLDYEGVV